MNPTKTTSDFQLDESSSQGLASKLLSAMSGFSNLRQEKVVNPRQDHGASSITPEVIYCSGAQGLASQSKPPTADTALRKDAMAVKAQAEQEESQHKMAILIENPQLWLQFKARLQSSSSGSGAVAIQAVLKDFIVDHPEIHEQYLKEKELKAKSNTGYRNSRRVSILESVTTMTAELSQEVSARPPHMKSIGFSSSLPGLKDELKEKQRRSSGGSQGSNSSSFMLNATELGLSFLKRAATVASATMGEDSLGSESETDWLESNSDGQRDTPSSRRSSTGRQSSLLVLSEQDEDASGDEHENVKDREELVRVPKSNDEDIDSRSA